MTRIENLEKLQILVFFHEASGLRAALKWHPSVSVGFHPLGLSFPRQILQGLFISNMITDKVFNAIENKQDWSTWVLQDLYNIIHNSFPILVRQGMVYDKQ